MKKLKLFESFLNEGSHTDFLMNYRDEIREALAQIGAMRKVKDKFTEEVGKKVEDRLKIYDKNVPGEIEGWIFNSRGPEADDLVQFGKENEARYGTEAQMILQAIGDAYQVVCTSIQGTPDVDGDEDVEESAEPVQDEPEKPTRITRFEDFNESAGVNEAKETMTEFQKTFKALVDKKLSKKSKKEVEVLWSKEDGIKPTTQIQFDCETEPEMDGDEQETYNIQSVLVTQAGTKFKVDKWIQMFVGNGGDDSKSTITKHDDMESASAAVAKYINDWNK